MDTEFDAPESREIRCRGCGKLMMSEPFWTGRIWIYPSCHQGCEDRYYDVKVVAKKSVPDRFKVFEESKFSDADALRVAYAFGPKSGFRTLAFIGEPGHGKSRWVEYWVFPDLVTEDRHEITKVKNCQFCFIDDIAGEAKGIQRSNVQDAIRARVQKNQWTFLTIDDPSFDPGFKDLFRQRAVEVYVE